ncbi:MAG TPA: Crp/Fnr family transcriptional regulator [Deltaproteobacteria bacterium]|jgi:CRP/FNR family transcriptional regulator|nr:Crp/Fnr family transcriptional regulator [Deltaproteobacteria bacterium]HOI07625.1 Crp/Fnr family transcriptional regulator [Deltaproteobacteria bacterium]
MDNFEVLRHMPIFGNLPEDQLRVLAECARQKSVRPGRLVFEDMERSPGLYLVVWGSVKIFKSSPEGKEQTIFVFGPGELFCLTAFVDEYTPANATALEDTRILYFPSEVMEGVAMREPSLVFGLLKALSRRLKEAMVLIESLSLKEIPQRLAAFLSHALESGGQGDTVELRFSQRELAKIIGATPETLSRVLRKLGDEGILSVSGRTIRILDRAALRAAASGEQAAA